MKHRFKIPQKFILLTSFTILVSCLLIGVTCYQISKSALIRNSEDTFSNLIFQSSDILEERITQVNDATFLISQNDEIMTILNTQEEELNPVTISTQSSTLNRLLSLSSLNLNYVDDAFLLDLNGRNPRSYHNWKSENSFSNSDLEQLTKKIQQNRQYSWFTENGNTFFIRKVTEIGSNTPLGFLLISLNSSFFEVTGSSKLFTDDNIVVVDSLMENVKASPKNTNMAWINFIEEDYLQNHTNISLTRNIDGTSYLINISSLDSVDWFLVGMTPVESVLVGINPIISSVLIVIILAGLMSLFFVNRLSKSIIANIEVLEDGVTEFKKGNLLNKITPINNDELGLLAIEFNNMGSQLNDLILQLDSEQKLMRDLEFRSLKAQINPHFLYNTLGSIKWASFNRKEVETASSIDSIINLLRITVKNSKSLITIREELNYISDYLKIQKIRYGDTLTFQIYSDPSILGAEIAGFFLQPFVENSILHGFDFSQTSGEIIISCGLTETHYVFTISDNGIGMDSDRLSKLKQNTFESTNSDTRNEFNGLGTAIVYKRLKMIYKDAFQLNISSKPNLGTIIEIKIPL